MKISVVGSINMDMTVTAERIPQKAETLKGGELKYIPGGKGANQAVAMARLGADVEMFGCVGEDENGRMLLENFKREGVKADHIQVIPGVVTGIALITVVEGANGRVDRAYVDSIAQELLQSELVVLQHEIPIDTVEYVVELCSSHGIKVILNPAPAHPVKAEVLEKVTYLTPNEHEAVILYGEWETEELLRNKDYLESVYTNGATRASQLARKTLDKVYRKVGFVAKPRF